VVNFQPAPTGLGFIYGFLQAAWPFGVVEVVWMGVALRKWRQRAGSAM